MVQTLERTTDTPLQDDRESGAPQKSLIEAIHDTLRDELRADDRVVILGEDVGQRGGVFRVTAGLLEEFGE
ncbi:MAG: 2-oxoisovalerate dehydrogenase component beta subunit, partial [Thermomicrobiales bacterium]|nr:2-oxoisovalerate dehydrogenase component beta subunit [Thermomicrobiales bacterium]